MSNDQEEYNGWPNRETWAVALHIDNDEGSYHQRREFAADAIDAVAERVANSVNAEGHLAQSLREWVGEEVSAVYHDPANATEWARMLAADAGSLWRVEWLYIAEHYIHEAEEELETA